MTYGKDEPNQERPKEWPTGYEYHFKVGGGDIFLFPNQSEGRELHPQCVEMEARERKAREDGRIATARIPSGQDLEDRV